MARTENLTVMFTDIVGFTERTSLQSRAQNEAMLANHNRLLLPLIGRFGGKRIKSIGDALLLTFRSPTDAVHCGMAMHDALAEYNAPRREDDQLHIRVAINVGEVRVDGRDVFGEAVNVASRVESLTPPDQIYFTEAVYLAMNKAEVPSLSVGKYKLKGIPEEVNLYQVPARQVQRLVPGGEDLGTAPGELPYGGMHRSPPPQPKLSTLVASVRSMQLPKVRTLLIRKLSELTERPSQPFRVALLAFLATVLTAALALDTVPRLMGTDIQAKEKLNLAPTRSASTPSKVVKNEEAGKPEQPPIDPAILKRQQAREWTNRGHSAFARNLRRDAVPAYRQALSLEPDLQNDPKLAYNLVECLSWASDLAIPLIKQYPSPAVISALSKRSGGDDKGAGRAIQLLKDLGHHDKIDPLVLSLEALKGAQTCEQKLAAVKQLRTLRSPRSLPALKAALGSGIGDWFKNSCFRGEAQKAIKEIEALSTAEASPAN